MTYRSLALAFAAAVLVAVASASADRQTRAQSYPGKDAAFVHNGFIRVIDGDTVEIWRSDRRWGIGLVGVDAPEGNTACGMAATARMWQLTEGGARFRAEEDVPDEKYRLMYHANTLDDQSIEAILVREGLAKVVEPAGQEGARLKVLEAEARVQNRGCVWGGKGGPPPTKRRFPPAKQSEFAAAAQPEEPLPGPDAPSTQGVEAAGVISVSGFQDRLVISGLGEPTTFDFAPDGRIFVAEKSGVVRLVKNGQLLATPVIDISGQVNDYWDHGLIGLALGPDFASTGYLYALYTYENNPAQYSGGKTGRLSRFTVVGDAASPSSEVVLMGTLTGSSCSGFPAGSDCIPSEGQSHSVGNVRFGGDGKLYATFGDAASFVQVDDNALRAQNLDSLAGKVVRVNPDGTGAPENPFWNGNPTSNRAKVWAYGVRNAFRFNFEPTRGSLYLGDVGWNEREELHVVPRGGNLGWPCYEGDIVQAGYESKPVCQALYAQGSGEVTPPLVAWSHNEGGCCGAAAVGGAFTTSYTAPYDGAYFYADYSKEWIRYLKVDADDQIVGAPQPFLTGGNGPVSLQRGPSGDIYYLAINTGEIRQIQQGSGNQSPTAVLTATPTDGLAPLNVAFSASGSTDPNFQPLAFAWDFGDGQQGSGIGVSHQYSANGVYAATLTVTDSQGASDTATTTITVGNRSPSVSIISPASGSTYTVGQTIDLVGTGSDPDDGGSLPVGAFTWRITLIHNTHSHPFLTLTGATNSFVIPDHGDNSHVVIEMDGVDSGGLHKTASVTIHPQTLQFTLDTSPPGLNVVYDGVELQAPFTATTIANSSHTIEAPSPQGTALFTSWSDGGAAQHTVTLGTANASRLATFRLASQIHFNDLSNPNRNFSGQYPSGVATWPTAAWYLSGPWGTLPTNSLSFQSSGQTAGTFSFLSPKVLLSLVAYNGGGASATVTLACPGNPTRSQVLAVGQTATVATNWTAACTTITVTSSNGWDTNFDDFVYDAAAASDTTPPVISGVQAANLTQTAATISWNTNEASTTQVQYGTSTAYGSSAPASPDTTMVTAHSQPLSALAPGTTYHYRVLSRDPAGNLATSGDLTFTTVAADTTPPAISAVAAGSISETSATVTWITDEPSTTQVEFGTTTGYGSLAPPSANTTAVTSHSQALSGLAPGTLHHYRVLSRDAAGNLATSNDFTFTTSAADTTVPVISSLRAVGVSQTEATITWDTDEPATTRVEYGPTAAYGSSAPVTPDGSLALSHSQALAGLSPGTTVHYRVLSSDASGNEAISSDFTFQTLSDATPPAISNVQSSGVTQTSATVTWTTDEQSSTRVEYGTTTSYGQSTPADAAMVFSHSQGLTGLAPGTVYHYRVHSVDAYGNAAVSSDFTLTTASQASGAWRFDGSNDRATASDSNSLDLTGPLTLEAWVKFDAIAQNKWQTIIFKQGLSNNLAYALYYHDGIWFEIKSGSGYIVLQDKVPLQTGMWYHIAAVYDRVTMRTYVNGQQTAQLPFTGAVSTSSFALTLGYNNVWSNEQLSGTIDEVRISSVARYSANFTTPSAPFTPDASTRALWHFDEATGQTTADASGNGNTLRRGTNLNAESSDPTWVAGAPLILAAIASTSRRRRPRG